MGRLHLDNNELSGAIPPELGSLTNLMYLSLSDNQLSGAIPPELSNLTNLTDLSLYDNQLSGAIPPELGSLSNLERLVLSDNQLSGAIPPELGSLSNLERLVLSDNQLSGAIPPELGNLSNPPVVLSALDLPKVVFTVDGEQKQMGVGEAIVEYGVDVPMEKLSSPSEVRAAFQDQTDLQKVRVLVVPIVIGVRPVGSADDAPWEPVNLNVFDAADLYGFEITVDQLIDPLYGGEVVKSSFEAYANLEVDVTDTVAVPVRKSIEESAAEFGVVIPPDRLKDRHFIERAFAEQANVEINISTTWLYLSGNQLSDCESFSMLNVVVECSEQ